ncbi:hypothetical protein Hanom_Chr05g00419741 [Helianthus anomalus]
MLLHGSPLVPFRFLVLNNIWIGQTSWERKIIPHSWLITALLKLYGVIGVGDKGSYKRFKQFDLTNMGPGWEYKEAERYHKLKSDGQRWRASKVDARQLLPGEADEPESGDEVESGDDDYREDTFTVDVEAGGVGPSDGTMEQVVERRQPPTFANWFDSNQMFFDQQRYMGASMERALKENYDWQEQWNHAHMYAHQEEMNTHYLDDRYRSLYYAWHSGQLVVSDPPIVDYPTLPPYDGSVTHPTPPLHHSQWVDPQMGMGHQQAGQEGDQGGSSSDSFGFGEFADVMPSIFGPPQRRHYWSVGWMGGV